MVGVWKFLVQVLCIISELIGFYLKLNLLLSVLLKVLQFEKWVVLLKVSFFVFGRLVSIGMFIFRQVLLMVQLLLVGFVVRLVVVLVWVRVFGVYLFFFLWFFMLNVKFRLLVGRVMMLLVMLVKKFLEVVWFLVIFFGNSYVCSFLLLYRLLVVVVLYGISGFYGLYMLQEIGVVVVLYCILLVVVLQNDGLMLLVM